MSTTPFNAAYTGSAAARLADTGGAMMPGIAVLRAWCASMAAAISADRSASAPAALLPAAFASVPQTGGPGPIIDSVLSLAALAVAVAVEASWPEISSIAILASARAVSTAALACRASAFACSVAPRLTSRRLVGRDVGGSRPTADAADEEELKGDL